MKQRWLIILLIIALMLSGCSAGLSGINESTESGSTAPELTETPAPTQEPVIGDVGDDVVASGGWIYYRADDEQGYSLYRMTEDGSQAEKLMAGFPSLMAVDGDIMYYIGTYDPGGSDEENCNLYRVDLGTGSKTLMMEDMSPLSLYLAGDFLYFADNMPYQSEDYDLFRLDISAALSAGVGNLEFMLNTGAAVRIGAQSPHVAQNPMYWDGWLYYVEQDVDDWSIRRIRLDGSEDEPFYKESGLDSVELRGVYGDQLFFTSGDAVTLYALSEDGELTEYPEITGVCAFDGEWAYSAEDDSGVYRCSLENPEKELLAADRGFTAIAGDCLLTWQLEEEGFKYSRYVMPKSGGGETALIGHYMEPKAERTPAPEYTAKTVGKGDVTLEISNGGTRACYKLVSCAEGNPVVHSVLTEPYTDLTLKFSPGSYYLKVAYGDEWLGDEEAFGENGRYITTDMYIFHSGFAYKLSTSSYGGDFSSDTMSGFVGN